MAAASQLELVRQRLQGQRPASALGQKQAAVAVVLSTHADELRVLLIRRAERQLDPWSGHMAFPGGHRDPQDFDLEFTALRELEEEVGLRLSPENILGRLEDFNPSQNSKLVVSPFVLGIDIRPELVLSSEVASAFWVPIQQIISGELDGQFEWASMQGKYSFPAWKVEENLVWGLTYRVLRTFLARVGWLAE